VGVRRNARSAQFECHASANVSRAATADQASTGWVTILITWAPVVALVAILALFMRRMGYFSRKSGYVKRSEDHMDRVEQTLSKIEEHLSNMANRPGARYDDGKS